MNVNPANNRITTSGYSYDANGNLTAMPMLTLSYDIENRLKQATHSVNGTDQYAYDPSNRRVWKNDSLGEKVYFYGVDGLRLERTRAVRRGRSTGIGETRTCTLRGS